MPGLVIGNPVRGDDFFDREVEQRRMWRYLESNHVLLLSARRVGKTSLMYRLRDTAADHEVQAALVSVAPAQSELDFVRRLYSAAVEVDGSVLQRVAESRLGGTLRQFLPKSLGAAGISVEFEPGAEEAWTDLGRALAATLGASKRRWVLLVDEVPIFVLRLLRSEGGRERAVAFLDWFRDLRQHVGEVRWVLAGSIGLDTLAERHRFTAALNDLQIVHLGAFAPEAADRFVTEVAASFGLHLAPAVRGHLITRVGWPLPFFLNLMVSALLDLRDEGVDAGEAAVDQAFARLVEYDRRAYFDHWRQRLYEQLDPREAGWAHALLDQICADHEGATLDTLRQRFAAAGGPEDERELGYAVGLLVTDGYVVEQEGRWRFRSPLLREFWGRHARGRPA